MHYAVGAIIKRGEKYLLIDRSDIPLGFAGVAGHVDSGESPGEALLREVHEEVKLQVISSRLLFEEEVENNACGRGVDVHYWYVYACEVEGEPERNLQETKTLGWYSTEERAKLNLEPVWRYWFTKLAILPSTEEGIFK